MYNIEGQSWGLGEDSVSLAMSRIPPPSSTHTPLRPPSTPSRSRLTTTTTPSKARTQPAARSRTPTPLAPTPQEPTATPLSIKEAIALRRAEAKKAQAKRSTGGGHDFISLDEPSPSTTIKQEDEDILGRWPVRETIERARSTGSLNLASRSLPCLPSVLFDIHLGITPDPLKSVPNEPVLPPSSTADAPRRGGKRDAPTWFEAQDLHILKAWNNDIVEIQHEISLFGSLKTIDLHNNKLTSLPVTFGDLTALTSLDLSNNSLSALPMNLFALPELTTLNISHNALVSLPFNAPFASSGNGTKRNQTSGGSFFTPTITRASTPLPRLVVLDASYNKITSVAIDLDVPVGLTKLDLSDNPLGINESRCQTLLQKLGSLQRLKELRFEGAELGDDALPPTLFSSTPFPSLRILDLGLTKVTANAARAALKGMKQEVTYDVTSNDPPPGVACIITGKKVVKEAWELELERRAKARAAKPTDFSDWEEPSQPQPKEPAASGSRAPPAEPAKKPQRETVKEDWEIEAEQGLLTEGGKRRARAAAAAAAFSTTAKPPTNVGNGTPSTASPGHSPNQSTSGFLLTKYYSEPTQTLELPESIPPAKVRAAHARTFSLAPISSSSFGQLRNTDLAAPAPTLPLSVIVSQSFSQTLRVLILKGRRMDKTFSLPLTAENQRTFLPNLEELNLTNCGLSDVVSVTRPASSSASGTMTPPRSSEPILPLIAGLFPSLRILTLSENFLTSASLTFDALSFLILATDERKGLKHLRLNGNRINGLDGFQELAALFKGNREVPGWKLDELDVSDNEIAKLPPELGLFPLDEFSVERNTFRVPQDKVWKREGTKGLLSWLRGRIA